ncbi:MAG: glycosyltransferase family 9 protein, partial [bacterium]
MIKASMKILVIEFAYIGDTLLTTPFLRALKEHHPYADITFLASSPSAEVLDTNPHLKQVLAFDKRSGLKGIFNALRFLRREKFDMAFVLHRSFKSALLAALAGIPVRIGYATEGRHNLLTHAIPYHPKDHRAENHLALFQYYRLHHPRKEFGPLGGTWQHAADPDNPVPPLRDLELPVPDDLANSVKEKFLQGVGDYFVLNPGGSWPTKRWLADRFAEVGNRLLAEKKWTPVVVGGPNDRWLEVGKGAIDL